MAYRKVGGEGSSFISDTDLSSAASGEVLKFDGTKFIPATDNTSGISLEVVMTGTEISNGYFDLPQVPTTPTEVRLTVYNGLEQDNGNDFVVISDGSEVKRISWNGLGLDGLLSINDILLVEYN